MDGVYLRLCCWPRVSSEASVKKWAPKGWPVPSLQPGYRSVFPAEAAVVTGASGVPCCLPRLVWSHQAPTTYQ